MKDLIIEYVQNLDKERDARLIRLIYIFVDGLLH